MIFPFCLVHSFENNDNDGTNNFCIEPLLFIRGNEVIGAWNIFKFWGNIIRLYELKWEYERAIISFLKCIFAERIKQP